MDHSELDKYKLSNIAMDSRGFLGRLDFKDIPFIPCSLFFISNVPLATSRGDHAHRFVHQYLIVINGSIAIETESVGGVQLKEQLIFGEARHIPPMIWTRIEFLELGTTILVLTSGDYDELEFIRDRSQFRALNSQIGVVNSMNQNG